MNNNNKTERSNTNFLIYLGINALLLLLLLTRPTDTHRTEELHHISCIVYRYDSIIDLLDTMYEYHNIMQYSTGMIL